MFKEEHRGALRGGAGVFQHQRLNSVSVVGQYFGHGLLFVVITPIVLNAPFHLASKSVNLFDLLCSSLTIEKPFEFCPFYVSHRRTCRGSTS